jgi:hypothetical protein
MSARIAVAAALLLAAAAAWAEPPAAEITMLTGRGTAVATDGTVRDLAKGDKVYSGDIVSSGVNSYLNLKFADGGLTLLRPSTRFQIEDYSYTAPAAAAPAPVAKGRKAAAPVTPPPPQEPRAFFKLLKGGFRAVSGIIGHSDSNQYRVSTPTATIGIRGTDYFVVYCTAECDSAAPNTTVIGVIKDGVFVKSPAGQQLDLGENEFMSVLPDGHIVKLPGMPHFLVVDPIPNPQTCQ